MTFRLLPWTRRGLVGAIEDQDTLGDDMAARAEFPVGVRVNALAPTETDLVLYGPGEVVGVDPKVIIRTDPERFVADFTPNYLATIEFDQPDFPWMFTPAAANQEDKLRPWLALVVVTQRDGVSIETAANRPLPVLTIESPVVPADELPDLAESWAWAHAQVATENDDPAEIAEALAGAPTLNLSRLISPRRLQPNTRYYACLVPTFAVGREAGLGQTPAADATTTPAWTPAATTVVLPLYYHWEFATSSGGDFEDLVDRLEARPVDGDIGTIPMYIGDAGPGITPLPPDNGRAVVDMEGALRAPTPREPHRKEIHPDILLDVEARLNAPDEHHQAGTPADAHPVGPPIYGGYHIREHQVSDRQSRPWFADVNLDLRMRAAAALGTQVVRANQEELMREAWAQVGDVLAANQAMSWAQLSLAASERLHARHLATADGERLMEMTAPMHRRVTSGTGTVSRALHHSRVPDSTADPAFRRAASPQNRVMKKAARRAGQRSKATGAVDVDLIVPIDEGALPVEDLSTRPDGLLTALGLDAITVPSKDEPVDMDPVGGIEPLPREVVASAQARFDTMSRLPTDPPLIPRADLTVTGVVGQALWDRLVVLADGSNELVSTLTGTITGAIKAGPGAIGLLVQVDDDRSVMVAALQVDATGQLSALGAGDEVAQPLAKLDDALARLDPATLGRVVGNLPPGALEQAIDPGAGGKGPAVESTRSARPTGPALRIERVAGTDLLASDGARVTNLARIPIGGIPDIPPTLPPPRPPPPPPRPPRPRPRPPGGGTGPPAPRPPVDRPAPPPGTTLPPPDRDPTVVAEISEAILAHAAAVDETFPIPGPPPPLAVSEVRTRVLSRTDPRIVVPKRMAARLNVGPHNQPAPLEPIMASPQFPVPMYRSLAAHAREFLLPGIGRIPPDTITLLETNPRFVEGFLIGLNAEMNAELLWREYPTDRRGTPFRRFWDRLDGSPDIDPIHTWATNTHLGRNMVGGGTGDIVLVIRGELLRRYPNTIIYAVKATADGRISEQPGDRADPTMLGRLDPDITFIGFDLQPEDLVADPGWYFVIQEQPTEPRFGFDSPSADDPAVPDHWYDATWGQAGVEPGQHLVIAGNPLTGVLSHGARFADNSAHLANILMQQPVMVAVHADLVLGDLFPGDPT